MDKYGTVTSLKAYLLNGLHNLNTEVYGKFSKTKQIMTTLAH